MSIGLTGDPDKEFVRRHKGTLSSSCFFSLGNHISRMVTDNKVQSVSNWMDEDLLKRGTSLLYGTINKTEKGEEANETIKT